MLEIRDTVIVTCDHCLLLILVLQLWGAAAANELYEARKKYEQESSADVAMLKHMISRREKGLSKLEPQDQHAMQKILDFLWHQIRAIQQDVRHAGPSKAELLATQMTNNTNSSNVTNDTSR